MIWSVKFAVLLVQRLKAVKPHSKRSLRSSTLLRVVYGLSCQKPIPVFSKFCQTIAVVWLKNYWPIPMKVWSALCT